LEGSWLRAMMAVAVESALLESSPTQWPAGPTSLRSFSVAVFNAAATRTLKGEWLM